MNLDIRWVRQLDLGGVVWRCGSNIFRDRVFLFGGLWVGGECLTKVRGGNNVPTEASVLLDREKHCNYQAQHVVELCKLLVACGVFGTVGNFPSSYLWNSR